MFLCGAPALVLSRPHAESLLHQVCELKRMLYIVSLSRIVLEDYFLSCLELLARK